MTTTRNSLQTLTFAEVDVYYGTYSARCLHCQSTIVQLRSGDWVHGHGNSPFCRRNHNG